MQGNRLLTYHFDYAITRLQVYNLSDLVCVRSWLVVAYIVFMEHSILVLFADVSMKPQLPPTSMKPLQPDKEAFLHKMLANVPQHRLTLVDAPTSTEHLEKIAASLISWKRACAGLGISEEEEEEITRETPILDSQRWTLCANYTEVHPKFCSYKHFRGTYAN